MGEITFQRVDNASPVAEYVAKAIASRLSEGQRVLWLLSGGSAIAVAVAAAKLLEGISLNSLTVTLADERFGPVDHEDSNWFQLKKAGLSLPDATIIPVLNGDDLLVTARKFDVRLQGLLSEADYSLALLGIGEDSHIAGILPDTTSINAIGMACGYVTPNFSRITITPDAFGKLSEAVAFVLGESKLPVLQGLQKDLPPAQYPSQFLKKVPEVTVFSDQAVAV